MLTQKYTPQLNVKDPDMNRIQSNIASAVDPVLLVPMLDATFVQRLVIPASGKLLVPHKLGRAAVGVMVVMASAAVSVPYALAADQTAPTGAIVLTFSTGAGATVSLWVF